MSISLSPSRRAWLDGASARDAGRLSFPDHEQLAFALGQDRVLVTEDRDYVQLHESGVEHAGILYFPFQIPRRSVGEIISEIQLIHAVLDTEEMRGRLEYI